MFRCKRCGYSSTWKHSVIKHLLKKKVCLKVLSDIDRNRILGWGYRIKLKCGRKLEIYRKSVM